MDKDTVGRIIDALLELRSERVHGIKVDERHGHELNGIDRCLRKIKEISSDR